MGWYVFGYTALLIALALVVFAVWGALRGRSSQARHEDSRFSSADLDILNEQLLRGEISREEFERRRRETFARRRAG